MKSCKQVDANVILSSVDANVILSSVDVNVILSSVDASGSSRECHELKEDERNMDMSSMPRLSLLRNWKPVASSWIMFLSNVSMM